MLGPACPPSTPAPARIGSGWHAGAAHGPPHREHDVRNASRRIFVGRPLATSEQEHQRLDEDGRARGVLLRRHLLDGVRDRGDPVRHRGRRGDEPRSSASTTSCPIAIGVALLIAIVVTSYRQTIYAYPKGGAAYVVSRENHGELPSLVAAASILVDYILTVAVSVSAGVAAIISIPQFHDTVGRTSCRGRARHHPVDQPGEPARHQGVGRLFAIPTYGYIVAVVALDHLRADEELLRVVRRGRARCRSTPSQAGGAAARRAGRLGLFLILKGFSSGAVALTGIEAISDGVPAFRRPEAEERGARRSRSMGTILATLFLGVSVLATPPAPVPERGRHRVRADGRAGVRRRRRALGAADPHRGHPDPRREHGLRRLPAAVVDRGARRLSPPPARSPRRPARVLERHRRARGSWRAR